MNDSPEKLRLLENLVEELLKDAPTETKICDYMREAGIPDSKDPIDRINKVLLALHFEDRGKGVTQ